jgi:hypothetical protein
LEVTDPETNEKFTEKVSVGIVFDTRLRGTGNKLDEKLSQPGVVKRVPPKAAPKPVVPKPDVKPVQKPNNVNDNDAGQNGLNTDSKQNSVKPASNNVNGENNGNNDALNNNGNDNGNNNANGIIKPNSDGNNNGKNNDGNKSASKNAANGHDNDWELVNKDIDMQPQNTDNSGGGWWFSNLFSGLSLGGGTATEENLNDAPKDGEKDAQNGGQNGGGQNGGQNNGQKVRNLEENKNNQLLPDNHNGNKIEDGEKKNELVQGIQKNEDQVIQKNVDQKMSDSESSEEDSDDEEDPEDDKNFKSDDEKRISQLEKTIEKLQRKRFRELERGDLNPAAVALRRIKEVEIEVAQLKEKMERKLRRIEQATRTNPVLREFAETMEKRKAEFGDTWMDKDIEEEGSGGEGAVEKREGDHRWGLRHYAGMKAQ